MVECQQMHIRRATPEDEQWGRDWDYLAKHHDRWLKEFGSMWVAVYKEQCVALADSIEQMTNQVESSGCPKSVAFIKLGELILNPQTI